MDILELTRKETSHTETIGVLILNKKVECMILEPPKLENEKGKSCIPTGQYICKRYSSKKYNCECLAVYDVPGREFISIHYGNTAKDTKGCPLTGKYPGNLKNKRAVLRSKDALKELMSKVGETCLLTVKEDF